MYRQGEAGISNASDSRERNYDEKRCINLPHSCSEWVIGGKIEAEQLIEDLKKLINEL